MLSLLAKTEKAVGVKQSLRALRERRVIAVFLAEDAEERLTDPVRTLAEEQSLPIQEVPTMHRLGQACGIKVGAAVAVLLKSDLPE